MSIYTYIRFKTSQDMIILGQRHDWIKMDTFLLFSGSLLQEKRCKVWGSLYQRFDLLSIHGGACPHLFSHLEFNFISGARASERKEEGCCRYVKKSIMVWDPYKTMLYTLWSLHYYARIIRNTLQRDIQTLISLYRPGPKKIHIL